MKQKAFLFLELVVALGLLVMVSGLFVRASRTIQSKRVCAERVRALEEAVEHLEKGDATTHILLPPQNLKQQFKKIIFPVCCYRKIETAKGLLCLIGR